MGWSNYIIIEEWKMIIETNREVDELEDYIKESLDKMISDDVDIAVSASDLKVSDITVKDLCTLASAYDNTCSLACMSADKLFLYWLENRDIEYEIKSEYNIDIEGYKEKGYKIVSRYKSDNDKDDENEQKTIDDSN